MHLCCTTMFLSTMQDLNDTPALKRQSMVSFVPSASVYLGLLTMEQALTMRSLLQNAHQRVPIKAEPEASHCGQSGKKLLNLGTSQGQQSQALQKMLHPPQSTLKVGLQCMPLCTPQL